MARNGGTSKTWEFWRVAAGLPWGGARACCLAGRRGSPCPQHGGPKAAGRPPSMSGPDAATRATPGRPPCCLCWCWCCGCSRYVGRGCGGAQGEAGSLGGGRARVQGPAARALARVHSPLHRCLCVVHVQVGRLWGPAADRVAQPQQTVRSSGEQRPAFQGSMPEGKCGASGW